MEPLKKVKIENELVILSFDSLVLNLSLTWIGIRIETINHNTKEPIQGIREPRVKRVHRRFVLIGIVEKVSQHHLEIHDNTCTSYIVSWIVSCFIYLTTLLLQLLLLSNVFILLTSLATILEVYLRRLNLSSLT